MSKIKEQHLKTIYQIWEWNEEADQRELDEEKAAEKCEQITKQEMEKFDVWKKISGVETYFDGTQCRYQFERGGLLFFNELFELYLNSQP